MKHLSSKKRLILILIALGICIGWYKLRHRWKEPVLIYKAPNLTDIIQVPVERTKYEEYEAILENKQNSASNKPKKSLVHFGLAKLFKPKAPVIQAKTPVAKNPSKPNTKQPKQKSSEQPYFFTYLGEEKADTAIAIQPQAHFFKARVYKAQKVKDKGAVVVKLQEKISLGDQILPAGTLLYGEAKFGQDRMYVSFTVAKCQEAHIPIHLQGYDQDLLQGFSAPGLVPSLADQAEGRVLQKATHHNGSGLLQDLGKDVADTWKEVRKKKEAFLEDRKGVYVRVADKKKS
jgi:hypothetical protein